MISDSFQEYEYNTYDNYEFSMIIDLPLELNQLIVGFLIGDAVDTGVVEALELMEVAESTHHVVCARTRSPIPYNVKMYVSEWCDTRDPDEVDEEVYSNATIVQRTAVNKLYLLFCLQAMVPTVNGQYVFEPIIEFFDPFGQDISNLLSSESFKLIVSCLGLLFLTCSLLVLCFIITYFTKRAILKTTSWIGGKMSSMWVRSRMGTFENDDFVGLGRITKYVQDKDGVYYEALIEGKSYKLYPEWMYDVVTGPVVEGPAQERHERIQSSSGKSIEMAQKNSSLSTAEFKAVGAIISTDGNTSKVIGGFFRIDNYLVTAQHVIEVVHSKAERFVLASVVRNGKTCGLGNYMHLDKEAFDFSNNVIKLTEIDCFAMKMSKKFWSQMGIQTTKCSYSHYDQAVTAVGVRNNILVCSTGLTSQHDKDWMLRHRATTYPGFSGFPVFRGKGIVGLHTGCLSDTNEMIRIETIVVLLPKEETPTVYFEEYREGTRGLNGSLRRMSRYFDYDVSVDSSGRIAFTREGYSRDTGLTTQDLQEDPEIYEDLPISNVNKFVGLEADSRIIDFDMPTRTLEQIMMEEDSNDSYVYSTVQSKKSVAEKVKTSTAAQRKKKRKTKGGKESSEEVTILPSNGVVHLEPLEHMTVPKIRVENQLITEKLVDKRLHLQILGYDNNKFKWPKLTSLGEKVSLEKHLQLFHKRCQTTNPREKNPLVREILFEVLKEARFEAPVNYRSKENLEKIINSSDVKDHKSPGYPYAAQGMANNQAVIAKYGVHGLVDLVTQLWDKKLICRVFNKGEPHSLKKIEDDMLRIIAGFPIHKTIKNIALFKNIQTALHESWQHTPIKFKYSPLVSGANKHLRDWLGKNGEKWCSDKSTWDFNMFPRYYDYCSDVITDLACKPSGMLSQDFDQYIVDVRNAIDEVKKAEYVTSDGSHYRSDIEGIMRSGWFMTIICNSIAQLAHHIEVCLKLGMTKQEILDTVIIAGGDDVIMNALKNYSTEEYISASKNLGIDLKIESLPSFEGCEFFSHRFYSRGRSVAAVPTRFTKHIENLRRATVGDEAGALSSLMSEWVWDDDKYEFFENLYSELRKNDPDNFPLKLLPNKMIVRLKLDGGESDAVNRS